MKNTFDKPTILWGLKFKEIIFSKNEYIILTSAVFCHLFSLTLTSQIPNSVFHFLLEIIKYAAITS